MCHTFTSVVLLVLVGALSSCVTPDPVYHQNLGFIEDKDYPNSTVVGMWMIAGGHSQFMENRTVKIEDRFYLLLREDGTGLQQEFHKYDGKPTPSMTERRLTWRSIGRNRWQFVTQPKTVRLLSEPEGMEVTLNRNAPPRIVTFRYYNGRLHPSDVPNTWVRTNEGEVKRKLSEIRTLLR